MKTCALLVRASLAVCLAAPITACHADFAAGTQCTKPSESSYTSVLPCYVQHIASQSLIYQKKGSTELLGVSLNSFQLNSQEWSPGDIVSPAQWSHDVDLYIPDHPIRRKALLIVSNGTNHVSGNQQPFPANDFSQEQLAEIARSTHTIVVAVSNIPNQFLTLGTNPPSREDASAAQSWRLFMENPKQRATLPLQVPMVAAVSRTMDLAQNELKPWVVDQFILSGASKRGWTAWLTSIADRRVVAIAPLVTDLFDTKATFEHIYRSYGGNWPIAFAPYYAQGITEKIDTDAFASLMQIQDPSQYANTRYRSRLSIPKYLINASGDDFFVPDNAGRYYHRLPGEKTLRLVPNSDHAGIRNVSTPALISLLNRLQRNATLPNLDARLVSKGHEQFIQVQFSEKPSQLKLWNAENSSARDFRYACGIRYIAEVVEAPADGKILSVKIPEVSGGWRASFIEATYKDGFIATTPAFITPQGKFPEQAPPSSGGACQTLPGR